MLGLVAKSVGSPLLEHAGVGLIGERPTENVGQVTSCWLAREFEESLAHASGFLWVLPRFRFGRLGGITKRESSKLAHLILVRELGQRLIGRPFLYSRILDP